MITCPYSTENAAPRMYRKGITKGFRCYLYIIIMMNHGKKIGMRIIGRPEVLPGDVERLAVAKAAADVDGEGRRYDGGRR